MKILKRLAISVNAQLEQISLKMQNHEAIAQSCITEMQQTAVQARVQLARISADCKTASERIRRLQDDEKLWIARIRKIHAIDKERAIACTRRLKQVRNELAGAQKEELELNQLQSKMMNSLSAIDKKLHLLKQKKNALACRESCAKALNTAVEKSDHATADIENVFADWEDIVMEKEIVSEQLHVPCDSLAEEFQKQEDDEEVSALLNEIIAKKDSP